MATFAKAGYNAATYALARPTYPRTLFERILAFHRGPTRLCADVGCGTGQVALEPVLRNRFERIVGVEPSSVMVQKARDVLQREQSDATLKAKVEFVQAGAEELDKVLEPGSVDLLVVAQAAHWFNWHKVWPQVGRVLRPGGTYALIAYSEFSFTGRPELRQLVIDYAQGDNWPNSTPTTDSLGAYWEQPGRYLVTTHLDHIPPPPSPLLVDGTRVYYTGDHYPEYEHTEPVVMRKKTTWAGVENYLRTFSSLHTFHEQHPEDKARRVEGAVADSSGDIAQRFLARVEATSGEPVSSEGEVEIEWPCAVVMGRRGE